MASIARNIMIATRVGSVKQHHSLWSYISGMFKRGLDTLVIWQRREQQRRHLRELDRDLLGDMGLSEADIVWETQKPFWKK